MAPEAPRPLRRVEYEQLAQLGAFADERVELLYGSLIAMTPQGPPHDFAMQRLTRILVQALATRADVRIQSSFAAGENSEPQPDVAVVPMGDYRTAHPSEAHLIIEVANSSLKKDRSVKARLYAEHGVPEYWVVDLRGAVVEVHSDIVNGSYARVTPYRAGSSIKLQRFEDVVLAVSDFLD
ncbi:MAG: Uma2 family endonuclease [Polyangiaceae bacterium]